MKLELKHLVPLDPDQDSEVVPLHGEYGFHFSDELCERAAYYAANDLAGNWISTESPVEDVRGYADTDIDLVIEKLQAWKKWLLDEQLR